MKKFSANKPEICACGGSEGYPSCRCHLNMILKQFLNLKSRSPQVVKWQCHFGKNIYFCYANLLLCPCFLNCLRFLLFYFEVLNIFHTTSKGKIITGLNCSLLCLCTSAKRGCKLRGPWTTRLEPLVWNITHAALNTKQAFRWAWKIYVGILVPRDIKWLIQGTLNDPQPINNFLSCS